VDEHTTIVHHQPHEREYTEAVETLDHRVWLAQMAGRRRDRRGTGIGIATQGAFLLVYDCGSSAARGAGA
jgi:hypothetical protein